MKLVMIGRSSNDEIQSEAIIIDDFGTQFNWFKLKNGACEVWIEHLDGDDIGRGTTLVTDLVVETSVLTFMNNYQGFYNTNH